MAQLIIDIGAAANDGTGDPARTAFDKINQNFTELYDGFGATIKLRYTQATHGFTGFNPVYRSGGLWVAADAAAAASSLAFVAEEVDANTLDVYISGAITGLTGLTDGEVTYLAVGGGFTTTAPSGAGEYIKPFWVADSTTTGILLAGPAWASNAAPP